MRAGLIWIRTVVSTVKLELATMDTRSPSPPTSPWWVHVFGFKLLKSGPCSVNSTQYTAHGLYVYQEGRASSLKPRCRPSNNQSRPVLDHDFRASSSRCAVDLRPHGLQTRIMRPRRCRFLPVSAACCPLQQITLCRVVKMVYGCCCY